MFCEGLIRYCLFTQADTVDVRGLVAEVMETSDEIQKSLSQLRASTNLMKTDLQAAIESRVSLETYSRETVLKADKREFAGKRISVEYTCGDTDMSLAATELRVAIERDWITKAQLQDCLQEVSRKVDADEFNQKVSRLEATKVCGFRSFLCLNEMR